MVIAPQKALYGSLIISAAMIFLLWYSFGETPGIMFQSYPLILAAIVISGGTGLLILLNIMITPFPALVVAIVAFHSYYYALTTPSVVAVRNHSLLYLALLIHFALVGALAVLVMVGTKKSSAQTTAKSNDSRFLG
ncbi:MAG TPA: hypothetical protein PLD47_01345 [Aggregatilineales bacterium]|nr:hypothetical protein [Anaerolineales bacterium]HRE46342.1 hypothetical protein [Aggregatilineales bacterium]